MLRCRENGPAPASPFRLDPDGMARGYCVGTLVSRCGLSSSSDSFRRYALALIPACLLRPRSVLRCAGKRLSLGLCLLGLAALPGGGASAASSTTLEKIRATGVISVGYREGSVPFSYLDRQLQPVGFSIDICRKVVTAIRDRLGLKSLAVRLVPMTPATRIPLVANGSIDLECGVTTHTLERQKSVAFSVTTFVTESRLVSRRAFANRQYRGYAGESRGDDDRHDQHALSQRPQP